jgi:cytochrome c
MKFRYLIALSVALSISATVFASDDAETLFKKSGCAACHKIDGKSVGPSYKDVAAKYKDDKAAHAKLEAKIRSGGKGSFGSMPMPPQKISDADIKTLVTWVLSQK